ncbi:MAG: TetR/AcrR family transcriptional regulator [Methanobacterium sp.]|nr:TetR/AcrR family transcriptional regulator [Methanobacterium sp.]
MTDETKEKLVDAALKLFAEEGYVGTKTRIIAHEAGFSEMTLFRKFKTKENLFDTVLVEKKELILDEIYSIFNRNKVKDPAESFRLLIEYFYRLIEDHFQCISIYVNERRRVSDSILEEFIDHLSQYLERKYPEIKINSRVFAFNILSFLYLLILDKNMGYSFVDHEKAVKEFIEYNKAFLI